MKKLICLILVTLAFQFGFGQDNVFVIGNLDNLPIKERLVPFEEMLKKEKEKFTLLIVGNIGQDLPENEQIFLNFLKDVEKAGSKVLIVTGDHDWNNSEVGGVEKIKTLEHKIKKEIHKNVVVPKNNCPGPYIEDIGENIRVIAINSQWWLHPYRKQLPTDSKCENILPLAIIDAINEGIAEAGDRKVFLIAHHPVISGGVFGGSPNVKEHLFPFSHDDPTNRKFLPVFGSFYHYFRQNVGYEQDLHNSTYKKYITDINKVLLRNENIIFCASHEYNLQLHEINSNYQIISGNLSKSANVHKSENSLYKNKKSGFAKVKISADKDASCEFYLLDPSNNEFTLDRQFDLHSDHKDHAEAEKKSKDIRPVVNANGSIKAGDYKASFAKRLVCGQLYRDVWEEPLQVPILDLKNTFGGLTPVEAGGSMQTVSVKLRSAEGRDYAFRSVNKTPAKGLPHDFRFTAAEKFMEDLTATQHPYAAMYVAELINPTGILHVTPKLYQLPDSPELGEYQKKFGGMFGMLEEKPKSPKKGRPGFAGADKVVSSLYLFDKMYESSNTTIDTLEFAKAVLFDILIGDWDRHEDNWKWAGFKDGKKMRYRPIPRDRDHAFSQLSGGIIPFISDREWGYPFREDFDSKFTGIRSLTWKTRHFDRFLLTSLSKEDWIKVANELASEVTDEVIDKALEKLPQEIREMSTYQIADKLKSRRKDLTKAVEIYYGLIAKEVDVVGTNKADFFKVTRLEDGLVKVQMASKHNPTKFKFERTFNPKETKEIRLYGLAKRDSFLIEGSVKRSILVRVMGGTGNDHITDHSKANGAKKTLIYDYPEASRGATIEKGAETRTIYSEHIDLNEYNRTRFKYNKYAPAPIILVNADDGFGGGLSINFENYGFGHRTYKSRYHIAASATTNRSLHLVVGAERNIARTNWFYHGKAEFGNFFPFYNFYGLGNNSEEIDSELQANDFYEIRHRGATFKGGITHKFLTKSSIKFEGFSELLEQEDRDGEISILDGSSSLDARNAGGGEIALSLDFRDSPSFATKGIKLDLTQTSYLTSSGPFGRSAIDFNYYGTVRIGVPITLGVKAGTERIYGNATYYHLANAGQSQHLRGYRANRFSGNGINYLNTDLRFHLGKSQQDFLPFYYGIGAFIDIAQVVENDELFEEKWHRGYGAGIYLTPINKDFLSLNISGARSEEESFLFNLGLGILF